MTTTYQDLKAQADALIEEADQIGDRFGNMGPMARKRKDNLYREASKLRNEAYRLELLERAEDKAGIICTGCGKDIGFEGEAELDEGYSGCCNKRVEYVR